MKYTNARLSYEKTSTMDNLNCKIQAHARMCEENKLEEKATPNETILQLKV